jgi:hypothetical protein
MYAAWRSLGALHAKVRREYEWIAQSTLGNHGAAQTIP